ncbi:hypothetical protein [Romboutsia sp.]|uniref:hypothetical protein n=1 Tax=Romboutsia sp. TaxID=1965302 RepID=UPI003F3E4060
MNNLLLIIGIIALSNGNISLGNVSLFDSKNKSKQATKETATDSSNTNKKPKPIKKSTTKKQRNKIENILGFNIDDINKGMKLMDLSDEDLERGMEIIARTKKYMSKDEKKLLVKVESLLDLVRGIKKLSSLDIMEEDETNFFRSMDEEDKKNMMIKEILEVFPEKRKDSIDKAIDMKKKIDLFAELFLPDDFGESGFSLSSLVNISNLGSMNNLKLLGNLLRSDDNDDSEDEEDYEEEDHDVYENEEDYYENYDYEDEED